MSVHFDSEEHCSHTHARARANPLSPSLLTPNTRMRLRMHALAHTDAPACAGSRTRMTPSVYSTALPCSFASSSAVLLHIASAGALPLGSHAPAWMRAPYAAACKGAAQSWRHAPKKTKGKGGGVARVGVAPEEKGLRGTGVAQRTHPRLNRAVLEGIWPELE